MIRPFLILILLVGQTFACLWDRDTLADEAKGRPALVKVITGWFDRYPPGYYEMRLERVTRDLRSAPNNLGLHDDAAVACARLGRVGEAMEWMTKKKVILDALPESSEQDHRYRYLSNLGTFYLMRWVSLTQTQREAELADLRESEKLITKAIADNPNAHFGREVYQLMAIRWLLWDGVSPIKAAEDSPFEFDEIHWVKTERRELREEHIDGLSGLIQLGIAWESSDAFRSLAAVLDSAELASLAELAYLRQNELLSAGKGSLHPVGLVRDMIHPDFTKYLMDRKPVGEYFMNARRAADIRNAAWIAYMEERFTKGMHPDTHPDFWNAWTEPAFPEPTEPPFWKQVGYFLGDNPILILPIGFATACLALLLIVTYIQRSHGKRIKLSEIRIFGK
jgi:tetratricopeptide (TPR) repeat protein